MYYHATLQCLSYLSKLEIAYLLKKLNYISIMGMLTENLSDCPQVPAPFLVIAESLETY